MILAHLAARAGGIVGMIFSAAAGGAELFNASRRPARVGRRRMPGRPRDKRAMFRPGMRR